MNTTVSARMDTEMKTKAEQVLSELGISQSTAIQALYAQIILQQALPFPLSIPQKTVSLNAISRAVRQRAEEYGAKRVWLFGSYARGEATEKSDVNLRIDRGAMRGLDLGGFQDAVAEDLGIPVDVATAESLSSAFLAAIRNEEVLLYESR